MPSVAQEEPIIPSSKKRRRLEDDSDGPILLQFAHSFHGSGLSGGSPRKILPIAKRSRVDDDASRDVGPHHSGYYSHRSHLASPSSSPSRHAKHLTTSRSPSSLATPNPDALQSTSANNNRPSKPNTARLSAPCHICHRRPTKKSIEQDDFGDCQACGERTCFICIRQCAGWRDNAALGADEKGQAHEHRQIVCSGCCVERGVDGDVVCLGCLPFVDG